MSMTIGLFILPLERDLLNCFSTFSTAGLCLRPIQYRKVSNQSSLPGAMNSVSSKLDMAPAYKPHYVDRPGRASPKHVWEVTNHLVYPERGNLSYISFAKWLAASVGPLPARSTPLHAAPALCTAHPILGCKAQPE